MIRTSVVAGIILLSGCRPLTAPDSVISPREVERESAKPAGDVASPALHIAPVVTRLEVTPLEGGIRFTVIFNHRFPGDHPVYGPFTPGGFAFAVEIDPSPPFDVSTWDGRRLWVLPAEHGLELRQTSLYGSEPRGSIPIEVRPRRIEFLVPYSALQDDDGLVRYWLRVYAVTALEPSGPVRVSTDTFFGETSQGE